MEQVKSLPEPGERRIYQFGEFRVDPVRRRLLRSSEPVPVTSKCFSLLVVLLERHGAVVDKEELFREVWPDTYVTEANLTQNVSSLRKALGERAGDKRYIVTVPGRGYSFVANVTETPAESSGIFRIEDLAPVRPFPAKVPEGSQDSNDSEDSKDATGALEAPEVFEVPEAAEAPEAAEVPEIPGVALAPAAPRRMPRPGILLLGIGLLLALTFIALALGRSEAPASPEPPPQAVATAGQRTAVAVLGFRDLAGNPETSWLGIALAEMLTTELSAGGHARLISGENVARARQSLSIPYTEHLRDTDLVRMRSILGADLVVTGAYLALDQNRVRHIRLDLRVVELPGGNVVATLSERGKESDLFEIVSRSGTRLRQVLGLHAPSAEQSRAVQAFHPSNPEAAELTARGVVHLRAFDPAGARGLLERAAEIEPGSAVIHTHLARLWYDIGNDARALHEARLALDLARTLPREERLAVEGRFYLTGKQWVQAAEIYRSLWTFFPDDVDHGLQLAFALINAGRSAEAIRVLDTLRELPAGRDDPRIDLETARAARRIADFPAEAKAAKAAEEKARRSGERLALAKALIYQGDELLTTGQPVKAAAKFREAERLAQAVGHPWTAGMALSNLGSALQALGDFDEAELRHRQSLDIARELGSTHGIAAQLYTLGILEVDRGELDEALSLLKEARPAYVDLSDRLMQGRVLAAMAQIELRQGDLAAARRSSEEAVVAAREVGNRADETQARETLASVLAWEGDLVGAGRELESALHLLRRFKKPTLATWVLASSSGVQARLGDLKMSSRRLEQAVAAERRAGDKMASGTVLAARAKLALRTGDVAQARTQSETMLLLARKVGSSTFETWALLDLGRAQRAAGDLMAARASFQNALRKCDEAGDTVRSTTVRLELARLELSGTKAGEAVGMARSVAEWAAPRGFSGMEAQALAVMAEALLREGRTEEAVKAGERIRTLLRKSQDRELLLFTAASLARIDAAAGNVEGAIGNLRQTVLEAEKIGHVGAALESRLALGEVEARNQRGDQTLRDLQRDAEVLGFGDLMRRASARG